MTPKEHFAMTGFSNEWKLITQGYNLWLYCVFRSQHSLAQFVSLLVCLFFCMARNWIFTPMQFPAECEFWLAIKDLLKAV